MSRLQEAPRRYILLLPILGSLDWMRCQLCLWWGAKNPRTELDPLGKGPAFADDHLMTATQWRNYSDCMFHQKDSEGRGTTHNYYIVSIIIVSIMSVTWAWQMLASFESWWIMLGFRRAVVYHSIPQQSWSHATSTGVSHRFKLCPAAEDGCRCSPWMLQLCGCPLSYWDHHNVYIIDIYIYTLYFIILNEHTYIYIYIYVCVCNV